MELYFAKGNKITLVCCEELNCILLEGTITVLKTVNLLTD